MRKPPFDRKENRLEYVRRLNEVPGVNIPTDKIDKKPSIPYRILRDEPAYLAFIDVLKWFVGEASKS